jgi:hypothetical protein
MKGRLPLLLVVAMLAGSGTTADAAQSVAECRVAAHLVEDGIPLPRVRKAVADKQLSILVLGAGSSQLPAGPSGIQNAYPQRLRQALTQKLPGVAVTLTLDVKSRRTAIDMVKALPSDLASAKPSLLVWQTGTVDAVRGLDQDQFTEALDKGVSIARSAGADVILINSQYSPRTESMIALGIYGESLRRVAVQHGVPLFDRFSVMKLWSDLGTFDLYSATRKLDIAERVHDCIGRLLADVVIEAAK